MEKEKKALENFLKPRYSLGIIVGSFAMVTGIVNLTRPGRYLIGSIIIGLIFLAAGGLILASAIRRRTRFAALTNGLAADELEALLSDFRTAVPIAEGNIRLGDRYFYPWRSGRYIAYGDVLQVYLTWHMLDDIIEAWNVIAVVRAGEETVKVTLFTSALRSKCDAVLREVEPHLLARNPNIQFGGK